MKNFKVSSVWVRVAVEVPIEVGSLSCNVIAGLNSDLVSGVDIDWDDIDDIKFDGIEVSDWKKLREFYKGMGIDIMGVLSNKLKETITIEKAKEIINTQIYKY
jgi:hypothetical protein